MLLFERATLWLLAHKVLLPGASLLERWIARLRERIEERICSLLVQDVSVAQQERLESWLDVPEGARRSVFDELRTGQTHISGASLVRALKRVNRIREEGISSWNNDNSTQRMNRSVAPTRLDALSRFALRAKVTALWRMSRPRRLAVLVAFSRAMEARALDEVVEILEQVVGDLFAQAAKADQKVRLRQLRDLDGATSTLAQVCSWLLEGSAAPEDGDFEAKGDVRDTIFARISRERLAHVIEEAQGLIRPPDAIFYRELEAEYGRVRVFLPLLLRGVTWQGTPGIAGLTDAWSYLQQHQESGKRQFDDKVPLSIVSPSWKRFVFPDLSTRGKTPLAQTVDPKSIDICAYTFCVLDGLRGAIKRREVFVAPSVRYGDPRQGLLSPVAWETARPLVCRTLGWEPEAESALTRLRQELDDTYRRVQIHLPHNTSVRFEGKPGQEELVLVPLEKLEEPDSLAALRIEVHQRLPRVDVPEILLEIEERTHFTSAFTHVGQDQGGYGGRADDLALSLCAVLLSEACNTGLEPLIRSDVPALRRDRLAWVGQNFVRDQTLQDANARLVAEQNALPLAHLWGGGEVASADGLRFVVPVKTIHAGHNPKYFGVGRGVTYYNMVSDQFTGLGALTVPGTLRDSLVLLSLVLEQETELQPTQIMTDTGAYSDIVFGLFRLLGYRFSPRLKDMGGTRFWRIDTGADYGPLNRLSKSVVNVGLIERHWDDLLRLAGSLHMGQTSPLALMRTLQVGANPSRLAQALAHFGRIDKTLHLLNTLDDHELRRAILMQLNRGEARHKLARTVFHGKRGELRQRYREGQEDQLGALGLMVNIIVLWNTIYIEAILAELRREGYPVQDADAARVSPLVHHHINMLGRYSFAVPEAVRNGQLRPLNPQN